jgi:flagellar assembly protein FliH
MILRNVTLASERQVLGLQEAPGSAHSRLTPERRVPQLEAVPQQAPVLTLEAVGQWLEQQSAQIRAACAQMLASELTALHLAAKTEGLELGREQAVREIRERATSSLNALARVVTAAESAFALEAAQLAQDCADIVAEVFVKLAGSQLATREAALGAVLAVLARVKDEREVVIRVSPLDLPELQSQQAALQEALGGRRWTLNADSRVTVGGCLVESTLGTLDGRLEIQLSELCETLRAAKSARLEGA